MSQSQPSAREAPKSALVRVRARSANYDAKRRQLLGRIALRFKQPDRPSLRELAAAADVSVPTLRHYFGDREGVVSAVLADAHARGAPFLALAARPDGPLAQSLRSGLMQIVQGHLFAVGGFHAIGLTEGLLHRTLGPHYLQTILEPALQAFELRLQAHIDLGELKPTNVRHAALALVAPMVLFMLHQGELGGQRVRPGTAQDLVDYLVDGFVAAWAVTSPAAADPRSPKGG